jgi:hypothetical protein
MLQARAMTTTKKLWIAVGILALLSPLGLIIPALFGAGGAWGEWGPEEVGKMLGFVPEGMQKLGHRWNAPLPDYAVPGQRGFFHEGFGYLLAAVLGVLITAGLAYALAKLLARKHE